MSEITTFLQLGVGHIAGPGAMDHILFLLALAAIYRPSEWRRLLWVVTAFTVGHSVTLVAAVLGYMPVSQPVVEFLIPVTIVATCLENIFVRNRDEAQSGRRYRPLFATLFGMVHGAGFAGYLKSFFADSVAVPLAGFNIGIEIGQIAVLVLAFALLGLVDAVFGLSFGNRRKAYRLRVLAVSSVVLVVAASWSVERMPW